MEDDIGPRQRLISRLLFSFRFINIKGNRMKMKSTGRKKQEARRKKKSENLTRVGWR